MNLTTTFDQLAEAEQDQTWHYVRMLEIEGDMARERAAFLNAKARVELEWRSEKFAWLEAKERVIAFAAEAERQCL